MGNNEPAVDQSVLRIRSSYDLNSCTRNKFQQRQYCARVMHFSAFH